jgi:Zn-dependent peptidase ImmA (M78 family)
MPIDLNIGFEPEILGEGTVEECAAFGKLTIETHHTMLTEGFDYHLMSSRSGPLVSAYYLAEWFAWNWWRLLWEPRREGSDWDFAHRMNNIGEGYVWPNITIFSDGVRTALISDASENPEAKPFRYFGANPVMMPSTSYEGAIDKFIGQVLSRLQDRGIVDSNLSRLWNDLLAERSDTEISQRRRIEAMLGREPDEIEDDKIEQLVSDAKQLGANAVEEVAADQGRIGSVGVNIISAADFVASAKSDGFDVATKDAVRLGSDVQLPNKLDVPAWRVGAAAAKALRVQEKLGSGLINNKRLAEMTGTQIAAVTTKINGGIKMSFLLNQGKELSKIVVLAPREEGRRFNIARLLGDSLLDRGSALHPATRASTYRQKAQRAFAAELLSPFEAVEDMMRGDYSDDMQEEVAGYFSVSPMTINTLLKNHGRIERDDPEQYIDVVAA